MRPIIATRDKPIDTAHEFSYYNRLQYSLTPAFAKHFLEKSTKKKAIHKNIFDYLEKQAEADRIQVNGIKGRAQRRNTV